MEHYECDRCHRVMRPSDEVIQAVEQVSAGPRNGVMDYVEGHTAIVHADHYPPQLTRPGNRWRKTYEGTLSGLRPAAE